jgi:hypothetical protein
MQMRVSLHETANSKQECGTFFSFMDFLSWTWKLPMNPIECGRRLGFGYLKNGE